jgi:hypothetical protein
MEISLDLARHFLESTWRISSNAKFPTEEKFFGQNHPNHQLDTCMCYMETVLYEFQKCKLSTQKNLE